jgi:LysM repeat protein
MGLSTISLADTVAVKPGHPDSYVVQKGDTLWDISGKFLQKPWLWPQVWEANPQIENPHLIYPGDVVALKYKDGRPILSVARGGKDKSGRYVKLSPTVRSYENEEAIPTIPLDAIKQFLTQPLIVTEKEMKTWPYVVSSQDEHLVAGAGDKIYVRGLPADTTDKRYVVFRQGKPLINQFKDKNNILGYEALYVADGTLEQAGDPASIYVTRSSSEILNGDRLAPESKEDFHTNFIPKIPNQEVNGNILSVINGVTQIGQYQIVVVDLGTNQGIEVGNVLGVYQTGNVVNDTLAADAKIDDETPEPVKSKYEGDNPVGYLIAAPFAFVNAVANYLSESLRRFNKTDVAGYLGRPGTTAEEVELPSEYGGVLMVFRTFENVSYALVMNTISPLHVNDTVKNL